MTESVRKEVEVYSKKIEGMDEAEADNFLWSEYINGRLSKMAHDWLIKWT